MPGTLFANSHCKMATIEKRRLPTSSKCGTCLRSRSQQSLNRKMDNPVASATSLMVTLMPMNFPDGEWQTDRCGSVKDHEVLQWVDYGEQLVEVLD